MQLTYYMRRTVHVLRTQGALSAMKLARARYWASIYRLYPLWTFEQSGRVGIGLLQKPLTDGDRK